MPRIIKWLLVALAAFAGLIALLVVAIMLFFDPNDYREDIERLVEEQTGQELMIEGDIGLSFFPWLGLDLGRTRLENREEFGDEPFVSIENAGVAVRILPLFRREVVLDTIRLDGLRANLIVSEAGNANWELDLPEDPDEPAEAPVPDEDAPDDVPAERDGLPFTVGTIQGVQITDLHVTYEDRQTGARHEAGPVNLSLGELRLDDDVTLEADWAVSLDEDTRLSGDLTGLLRVSSDFQRFRAEVLDLNLNTEAEGLPDGGLDTSLRALLTADLETDSAELSDLVLEVAGLRLNAAAEVASLTGEPTVDGRFNIPGTDLREVLDRLGQDDFEPADDGALRSFSLTGAFLADADRAELTELLVELDDTELSGTASIADFADPMIRFDFAGTRFNADRYLPEGTDEPGAGGGAVAEADEEEGAEIPLEPLRALNLEGQFTLEQLIVAGFELADINIEMNAADGRIRIHPLTANLYDGTYAGDIRLDATGDELLVRVDERMEGVQAQPIVQQFLGRDLLRGTANMRLQGETRGNEPMELVRELVAQVDLSFSEGSIIGINLEQTVRNAVARLRDESTDDTEAPRTAFQDVDARLSIDRGVVRNDDLRIRSEVFDVRGVGEAHVFDLTVDYLLETELVGGSGSEMEWLRGVTLPVRFDGSLLSPDISLDLAEVLSSEQRQRLRDGEAALRERADEEAERARERLREERQEREGEVRERARDELRRLFD
ncbi:AsmA family protein [Aquisalimonas asiatica]|uniref:AsmA protein n=1 Tax=Aquisalimonas asiatica TaxID=406100 RepID=A0A1H8VV05_9GAMM|nr:AsmA family protein [Aquisalimonas asiatica]SEP19221.1 AsmA protein [Aquisalimonas asiatica]